MLKEAVKSALKDKKSGEALAKEEEEDDDDEP